MNKKELRQFIRNEKRQYSSSQLEELSLSVLSRLNENEHLQKAKTILMYYSLPDEVNTHQYIDYLLALGKKVLLPEVTDGENMVIREYTGKHDLKEGAFHIMEPIGSLFPKRNIRRYISPSSPAWHSTSKATGWAEARDITTDFSRKFRRYIR